MSGEPIGRVIRGEPVLNVNPNLDYVLQQNRRKNNMQQQHYNDYLHEQAVLNAEIAEIMREEQLAQYKKGLYENQIKNMEKRQADLKQMQLQAETDAKNCACQGQCRCENNSKSEDCKRVCNVSSQCPLGRYETGFLGLWKWPLNSVIDCEPVEKENKGPGYWVRGAGNFNNPKSFLPNSKQSSLNHQFFSPNYSRQNLQAYNRNFHFAQNQNLQNLQKQNVKQNVKLNEDQNVKAGGGGLSLNAKKRMKKNKLKKKKYDQKTREIAKKYRLKNAKKVVNPETGRKIKFGGPTWLKIFRFF